MTDPTARQTESAAAQAENPTAPEQADAVAEAKREAAEFKDKLLRTLAEMENLRKRTEREVLDARLYGIAGFARDVLAVADNMHRALETIRTGVARKHGRESKSADRRGRANGT